MIEKQYRISEKLKNDLVQHFETKYTMAQVEKIVLELRNLSEIKEK